jgi:endo-1,4-beta-xylanase
MKRRHALQALSGAAVMTAAGCASTGPAFESLDAIGRRKGLRVGSAIGLPEPGNTQRFGFDDAAYRDLVARECGVVVCENEMKWHALRPGAQQFSFGPADTISGWARSQGLLLRGHTLLWADAQFFPGWLKGAATDASSAEALLTQHIATVCTRYPHIESWDVVNEAISQDTGDFRSNPLSARMGALPMIEAAFRAARRHAPQAQLVYNDFMGWGPGSAKHRAGVLRLLRTLKQRGVPIDALGLQAHVGTAGDGSPMDPEGGDERAWRQFLDEATALGLDLLITEFDVNDRYLAADTAQRDQQVAGVARLFLDITLSYPRLQTLMFWGLADHLSWLQNRWPRTDGLPKRPAPYDEQLRAKPLREAVAQALRAMPQRLPRRVG